MVEETKTTFSVFDVLVCSSSGIVCILRKCWAIFISLIDFLFAQKLPFLLFSHSVISDSLRPHGLQHTRLPCPSQLQNLLKLMFFESVMPSNHLVLCCPLLFLPSIFLGIRIFSCEFALCISWPKYWSFSFSISPSNEYSELISFRIDWFDLLYFIFLCLYKYGQGSISIFHAFMTYLSLLTFFCYFQAVWFICEFFQIVANLQKYSNIFIGKNPHIGGHVQFKPVLFRCHLYLGIMTFFFATLMPFSPLCLISTKIFSKRLLWHNYSGDGSPHSSVGKEPACNVAHRALIPGSGKSPGEGNGSPFQYSCLENPMDREACQVIVHRVSKSQTRLND